MKQRRLQAMELSREQKELVENRQRQNLIGQIKEQEKEIETLTLIKDEFVEMFFFFVS